jgi:hypothetical protein
MIYAFEGDGETSISVALSGASHYVELRIFERGTARDLIVVHSCTAR